MNKNLTDINVILDRSGSMDSCKEEAENGLNHFVSEQKEMEGDALFSLVQFDHKYEFVYNGEDIQNVEKYKLIPRGMTALLDAIGRSINETKERISKLKKKDRPGLVIFCIVTDGGENSSHEFNRDQVRGLIEKQTKEGWQFTFLGANQDAFHEAGNIGISASATTNYSTKNSKQAFCGMTENVQSMRASYSTGEKIENKYTDEQRKSMTE